MNTPDTSTEEREAEIKHIVGNCNCKRVDKTCWYWRTYTEAKKLYPDNEDYVLVDNYMDNKQVKAIANFILQERARAREEGKLEGSEFEMNEVTDWLRQWHDWGHENHSNLEEFILACVKSRKSQLSPTKETGKGGEK